MFKVQTYKMTLLLFFCASLALSTFSTKAYADTCMYKVSGLRFYKQTARNVEKTLKAAYSGVVTKVSFRSKRDYIVVRLNSDICTEVQKLLTQTGFKHVVVIHSGFDESTHSSAPQQLLVE